MHSNLVTVSKSSRHSKITGDFAEQLILYWLSKHGFECDFVDHVGIDIIARNPHSQEVMGISVKARSRSTGKHGDSMNIDNSNLIKIEKACQAFNCQPYFAVVIDEADSITAFLLRKSHLVSIHPPKSVIHWKMRKADISKYESDPEIKMVRFLTSTGNWWNKKESTVG